MMRKVSKKEKVYVIVYIFLFSTLGFFIPEHGFYAYKFVETISENMSQIIPINKWIGQLETNYKRNMFFLAISNPFFILSSFFYMKAEYKKICMNEHNRFTQTHYSIMFIVSIACLYFLSNFKPINKYSGWLEISFTSDYIFSFSMTLFLTGLYCFLFLPLINWAFELKKGLN